MHEVQRADEGQERPTPSDITITKRDKKGSVVVSFRYLDQGYQLKGRGTIEEFTEWINEYTKTAETCTTCDKLMLPGENAGIGEDGGYTHMTDECSLDGLLMLAGRINANGQVETPEEWVSSLSISQKKGSQNNPIV